MRVTCFKVFQATYAGVDKLAHTDHTDAFNLLHLQWAVIPYSRTEASFQHQGAVNADRIVETDLAIDDTSNQAVDLFEYDLRFKKVLTPMLGCISIPRDISRTEDRLDDQRYFVCW